MTTWTLGDDSFKVKVTAVQDGDEVKFTIEVLEGSGDINALWLGDATSDANVKLAKSDNSLNMNGTDGDFNHFLKISNAGLGDGGLLTKGDTVEVSWTGSLDDIQDVGIRATSVNGGDSVKLVAHDPDEPEEPNDDFPDSFDFGISHITLYYDVDTVAPGADTDGRDPDGVYTVKIDEVPGSADQDLDQWIEAVKQYLIDYDDNVDENSDLLGVAIKYGNNEEFFAYGDHNTNGTDPDAPPPGPYAGGEYDQGGNPSNPNTGPLVQFVDNEIDYSELGFV